MAVVLTGKSGEDTIKNEGARVATTFLPSKVYGVKFSSLKGNFHHMNCTIRSKIELIRD